MGYRAKQRILNWRISKSKEGPKEMFLVIREMQTKTTLRFQLIPVWMADMKLKEQHMLE